MKQIHSTVISKIKSTQPSFTMVENQIGNFVLQSSDFIIRNTITAIAQKIGTSEASINRFCKKLGYKGFNQFKIELVQELYLEQMTTDLKDPQEQNFIDTMTQNYYQLIVNTSLNVSDEQLKNAMYLILNSQNIYIYGLSDATFIAQDLQLKLLMIGQNVRAISDSQTFKLIASNTTSSDLVIIISPTLLLKEVYQTLEICKERGCNLLSLTSYNSTKLNDLTNLSFITPDKISIPNSLSLSNNLMYMYVIDLIYSLILKENKDLREKKLNSDAVFTNQQVTDNSMWEL